MAPTASGVRWDRVGRMALLFVGVLLICLYVNPLRTYVATRQEAKTKRAEVAADSTDAVIVREARRLGYVRTGERPFVVENLPSD